MHIRNLLCTTAALALLAGCATTPPNGGNGGGGGGNQGPQPIIINGSAPQGVAATVLDAPANAFDSGVPKPGTMLTGNVLFVWSDIFGAIPSVTTGHYHAGYRSTMQSPDWFLANEPSWIMRKEDQSIAWEYNNTNDTPLDIGNPAVIAYLQQEILAGMKPGQTWICLDNIDPENSANEVGHYDASGNWVQQYTGQPNDAKWTADNVNYINVMTIWAHSHGLQVMINNAGGSSAVPVSQWEAFAAPADGIMKEGWPQDNCSEDPPNWIEGRSANGSYDQGYQEATDSAKTKPTFLLAYNCGVTLANASPDTINWVTVSRLLTVSQSDPTKNLIASPCPNCSPSDDNIVEVWPSEMFPMIGPITDPPPSTGNPYIRKFAHGVVELNSSSTVAYSLIVNGVPISLPPLSAQYQLW
jgi:hypothetical protein